MPTRSERLAGLVVFAMVGALLTLGPTVARAEPVVQKRSLEIFPLPELLSPRISRIHIDQPLGKLTIRGWNRKATKIVAVKRAPNAETVERLRVFASMERGAIKISTRVRMAGRLPLGERLRQRALELTRAMQQLQSKPKPWSVGVRAQYQRLTKELGTLRRTLLRAMRGEKVETLKAVPLKGATLDLTVFVPLGVAVAASTHRGDIDAANLNGPLNLSSRRGRISARNVTGEVKTRTDKGHQFISKVRGPVEVKSTVGDLRMHAVSGPQVRANLVRGNIVAQGMDAPFMRLTTTQGNITVTATLHANGKLVVRTRRGDIDVRLQRRTAFRFKVATDRGRIRLPGQALSFGLDPQRRQGRYRKGGGLLDLRSIHGSIRIR